LIISASGDAATTEFLGYTNTGTLDNEHQRDRLSGLGATPDQVTVLMMKGRLQAEFLVIQLRAEIEAVAELLRARGRIYQPQIDQSMRSAIR